MVHCTSHWCSFFPNHSNKVSTTVWESFCTITITIIFFILGIVVVGAYAVLYTVVEAMIKAGSPEKDYEALMMAAKILRYASFGVLGFAGLGFLLCLLGVFISKRKGTAIAGIIIGLFSLAFMIIILFVPQVLQPIIDSISKTFS